jgi:hypothetical protein
MHAAGHRVERSSHSLEGLRGRAVPGLQQLLVAIEREHRDVLHPRLHQDQRRSLPVAELALDLGLHHDLEAADVRRGEAHRLFRGAHDARRRDVDGEDRTASQRRREPHRQVLHHRAVHVRAAGDDPRREDSRQRAGGDHRVGHLRVEPSGKAPHDLDAGMEIGGVDQQSA